MDKRRLVTWFIGATGLALAACDERPMDVRETFNMTPPTAHGTGAKTRLITTTTPGSGSSQGRITPNQIICAEPSPDTASSLSTAITAAFSGSGSSQGQGISAAAAGQFGKALSESLVQMTERTATIQLLRDGLHRACEAYANGAISDITYALIISRIDEVMVTMMTSELAAGAVGRRLAATSGQAGFVQGADGQSVQAADQAVMTIDNKIATNTTALGDKRASLAAATKPDDKARLQTEVDGLEVKQGQLAEERSVAQAAAAMARLGKGGGFANQSGQAAGSIDAHANPVIAAKLVDIYSRFMDGNPNKKMAVACISALDRPTRGTSGATELESICKEFFGKAADEAKLKTRVDERVTARADIVQQEMAADFTLRLAQIQATAAANVVRTCATLTGDERMACLQTIKLVAAPSLQPASATSGARPAIDSATLPPIKKP